MLSEIFKPEHNKEMPSLQFCKLTREQNEKAKEWMGQLRLNANECGYKGRQKAQRPIYKWYQ